MRMIKLDCPSCGAELEVGDDRQLLFCQYCGHKILLDDESLNIRLAFDNAREAGYEFERGRMEAQEHGSPVFETANKLKEMVEPAKRLEELHERKEFRKAELFSLERKQAASDSFARGVEPIIPSSIILIISFLLLVNHEVSVLYSFAGVVVALLLGMYNIRKTQSEKKQINALVGGKKEEIASLQQEYDEIIESYEFNSLPEDYWDPEVIDRLYRLLMTARAVNIQQAIVIYEEEQREEAGIQQRQNELQIQEEHLRALSRAIEEKNEGKKSSDGVAVAGAMIGAAILLRKLLK